MHKNPFRTAACGAALLALGACSTEPETVTVNQYDPQADALAKATPKQLPPSITASRTYRCADNSLFYVDFYNNNTAMARSTPDGVPTMLTAAEGNPAYTAEGYSVSANAATVRITAPGKNNISCRARQP
jgi:hypothetical protein